MKLYLNEDRVESTLKNNDFIFIKLLKKIYRRLKIQILVYPNLIIN